MPIRASQSTQLSTASSKRARYSGAGQKKKRVTFVPTMVRMGRQSFPKQQFMTLKYSGTPSVSVTAGVPNAYQFSCNGCFDPDITGSGHQPLYFDQMMAIYDHYTVLRSRIKATFIPLTPTTRCSQFAVLYIEDDTTTGGTGFNFYSERPGAKTAAWDPTVDANPTLYLAWSAAATFGPNPQAQSELQGDSSSNPSEQSYFTLVYGNNNGDNATYLLSVEIEYDVVFDEFKTIAQS